MFTPQMPRPRLAFTLIELLISIAIVALLLGLVLSAVQKARVSATKTRCTNNLRQLVIATHSYEISHQLLPIGVTDPAVQSTMPLPYLNWHARLLPQLEQNALWDQVVAAYSVSPRFGENVHTARGVPVATFLCPADTRSGGVANFGDAQYGLTSYLGVAGLSSARQNGILYLGSRHRLTDITDGTSSTILIGERPPSSDFTLGWWYAGWGQNHDGDADGVLGVRAKHRDKYGNDCPTGPYHFTQGRFDNPCDAFHFWSPHTGGANFAFADGSVKFLRYSADEILPALATRAGGEAVTLPE